MPDADYPTTCAELKAMIEAQWPKVRESVFAVQGVYTDILEFMEESDLASIRPHVWCLHRVVRSCGLETEGQPCKDPQLFFTEEQAVRAMWWHYCKLTPAKNFENDETGVLFIWRMPPELDLMGGCYRGFMRYSGVYKTRDGKLRPMWNSMQ